MLKCLFVFLCSFIKFAFLVYNQNLLTDLHLVDLFHVKAARSNIFLLFRKLLICHNRSNWYCSNSKINFMAASPNKYQLKTRSFSQKCRCLGHTSSNSFVSVHTSLLIFRLEQKRNRLKFYVCLDTSTKKFT